MRIIREIVSGFNAWLELIVCAWPESYVGYKLRRNYWRNKYSLVTNPHIGRMSKIYGNKLDIYMGKSFICGENVEINFCTSKGIYIGDNVAIAKGTYIRAGNHKFDRVDIPITQQGHDYAIIEYREKEYSIVIEDDVWIAANVVLLSGAKIGKGSIISAGSVVSNEIPPYSIVVGNPGRVMANRLRNKH